MSATRELLRKIEPGRELDSSLYARTIGSSHFGPQLEKLFRQRNACVKRRVEGPFARSGPVDDIRGQFRNCVSVEFAVGANDRKTRSADTRTWAAGALSWRNNCGLRSRSTGIIMRRDKYFGARALPHPFFPSPLLVRPSEQLKSRVRARKNDCHDLL